MPMVSSFQQPPLASPPPVELVGVTSCGRAALWLGLLRKMDLRGTVDRFLRTESELSHGEVVEALVLNRLTSPRPLYRIEEWARGIGIDVLTGRDPARYNDDRIGRTLDVLGDRVDDVQAALTLRAIEVFGLAVSDTHYDTTTLLLEGDYEASELAARGHSKEHKPDHKQVKLGLVTTADGEVPLAHLTLAGNTGDVATVPAALARLREQVPTQAVVISGDGVMWSQANMNAVAHAGGVFLGPIAMNTKVVSWVRAAELQHEVTVSLVGRSTPVLYRASVVSRFSVDGVANAGAHLVVFDPRRAAAEVAERAAAIVRYERALGALAGRLNVRKLKTRKAIEDAAVKLAKRHGLAARYLEATVGGSDGAFTLTWSTNAEALAAAPARDGKWPLVTNKTGLDDAALCEWAVRQYKSHGRIERDMHLIKGPLKVRPIFVQNDTRIRALVAISVWALQALTILERAGRRVLPDTKGKGPIPARLEAMMEPVAAVTYRVAAGAPLQRAASPPPPRLVGILRELGWWPEIRGVLNIIRELMVPS